MNSLGNFTPGNGLPLFHKRVTNKNTDDGKQEDRFNTTQVSPVEVGNEVRETDIQKSEHAKAKTALEGVASIYSGIPLVQRENQANYQTWMDPILSFFNSGSSIWSKRILSTQEKSALIDRLFEKMLSVLASLEIPNQPSLFLVYAHHNLAYGRAKAEVAKYLINKLTQLRVQLYSDQTPLAQPYSGLSGHPQKDGQLEDILTSQLCLLPTQLRSEVKPVDKVVVCCSEVLAKYLDWPAYSDFYLALQQAYLVDAREKRDSNIRRVVNTFCKQDGFHHVLTEMAFLHIRAEELTDGHGIIPVELTEKSYRPCLARFIDDTRVRITDFRRFEQQAQAGQAVYPNQGRHAVMFKLIERLFITSDEAKAALDQFWNEYSLFTEELKQKSAAPTALEYFDRVEATLNKVQAALNQQALHPRDPSLRDLHQALSQHYYHLNLSIQRVSGETASLEDCYINLALVEQQAQLEKDKKILEQQAASVTRLPSSENLQEADYSKLIKLEHLFDAQKLRDGSIGFPKRILIQGRAGIGKTTLCKKLVYDYQHQASWKNDFAYVLWIPLRQLKTFQCYSLEKLLSKHYFASQINAKALTQAFLRYIDKTLFILDGLDEVIGEFDDDRPLSRFLKELLNQKHVVMTSRPAGVDSHRLGQLDLELETVGFTPDNVQTYIQTFVPEANQTAIQQFIKRTPLIQGLVNIPIQLDALCYSWDSLPVSKRKQGAITMSVLYQVMVEKLWHKDGARLGKKAQDGTLLSLSDIQGLSLKQIEKQLVAAENEYLSYLAFKGLQDARIEFDLAYLNDLTDALNETRASTEALPLLLKRDLKQTSFLHTADAHLPETQRAYHFLHLTFQEFFAAKFLARHLQAYAENISSTGLILKEEQLYAFIASHKYDPRYEIVLWMVAGLLRGHALVQFFTLLEAAPHDLIGLRHQQVMMGCLSEARSQLNPPYVARLEEKLRWWLRFEIASENCWASFLLRHHAFPNPLLLSFLNHFEGEINVLPALLYRPALSETILTSLANLIKHENKQARDWVFALLSRQQTLSDSVISNLIDSLKHEDEPTREWATRVLIGQKALSDRAISDLIDLLKHENELTRESATAVLRQQKALSDRAISDLIDLLKHENGLTKKWAAGVLIERKILSDHIISDLISLLKHENMWVREVAGYMLTQQENRLNTVTSPPNTALQKENKVSNEATAPVMNKLQASPTSATSTLTLVNLLADDNEVNRAVAVQTLMLEDALSDETLSALRILQNHKDVAVKESVLMILERHKFLSEESIESLIAAVQRSSKPVRRAAAQVLSSKLNLLYPLLPDLTSDQIQALYRHVFLAPRQQVTALYIQESRLCFYTAGNLKTILLEAEQVDKVTQAFITVQKQAQLTAWQKEE